MKVILIVDDEALVRSCLVRLLGPSARVFCATSVADALALVTHLEIDAIVSDLDLGTGTLDGLWLLEQISTLQPHAQRLLLTGAPNDQARRAVEERMVHELLEKPTTKEALLRATGCGPSPVEDSPPASNIEASAIQSASARP